MYSSAKRLVFIGILISMMILAGGLGAYASEPAAPAAATQAAAPQAAGGQEAQASVPEQAATAAMAAVAPDGVNPQDGHAWWFWPMVLFILSFVLGIFAVLGGVGGGVLYVPIVSGFLPFHLDFVRGAGLIVALCGALAAGPGLLKKGMADLRLALPVALIASSCAIVGAMIGLALPTNIVQTLLGATILGIVVIMALAKKSDYPIVPQADSLSQSLRIMGVYHEPTLNQDINWKIHRTPLGLSMFILIGVMAGMFGLGAGWANVPVLNLMMGAPIKISVATSKFLLSITDTSAAWIYLNNGAVLPIIVVPSVVGIMFGSFIGVRILAITKPSVIKVMVIVLLLFAGGKALHKGLTDKPKAVKHDEPAAAVQTTAPAQIPAAPAAAPEHK